MPLKTKTKKNTKTNNTNEKGSFSLSTKQNISNNQKTSKKIRKLVIDKKELKAKKIDYTKKFATVLFDGKMGAKSEIFKSGKCIIDIKTPLILIFATDLNGEKELVKRDDLYKLLEGLRILDIRAIIIDTQQASDINNLSEVSSFIGNHIIWYNPKTDNSGKGREEKEIDRLLLATDMAIVFNSHLELIHLLMNYGIVIIGEDKSPLLSNYKPNEETGNAFLFSKKDHWSIFAAIIRAIETFKFPYDWKHIMRKIFK